MTGLEFDFAGERLTALPSGALWWPARGALCVSDLHLGKSERVARRSGQMLPPYETQETLDRLEKDITDTAPQAVICLGDSFDDLDAAAALEAPLAARLTPLMAGRTWIWIAGNHDPGPVTFGGTLLETVTEGPLRFRHVAAREAEGEVSGHYHPKALVPTKGRAISRPCFLLDARRLILPAYGAYTGGLYCHTLPLTALMAADAKAILLGAPPILIPMPRKTKSG